jgi:hypothetical protein
MQIVCSPSHYHLGDSMSEETNSSAAVSENENPETAPASSGKPGTKPWMKIAAVLVAIILVSTALYFLVLGAKTEPTLTATISPSPASVDAGTTLSANVTVKSGDKVLTDKEAKLKWSVQPNNMGTFDFFTKSSIKLAVSSVQQNGTLKCDVEYNGKTVHAQASLQIRPPGLDRASVSPSEIWVRFNTSQVFTAKGVSTIGSNMTGLTFTWTPSGLPSSAYVITPINDTAVRITAKSTAGNVTLNATTTYKTTTRTGSGTAKITQFLPTRTVDYRWYDVFKVPFGPWYPRRTIYYPGVDYEAVWSNSYPYIYVYYGDSAHHNLYLYSNMRLNITAVNLPDVNMSRPLFLPMFGSTTGGHAILNWHMQYLDPALVDQSYGASATAYNDGWVVNLTGVTTLDKDAAMAVTGMTSAEFDNFPTYWATKGLTLRSTWQQWLIEGQANGVYDIYNMYASTAQMIGFGLHGQKVGDKVILTVYADTWGMDALIARWLRAAFVPTEVWMEGFWMNATIGPQTSNIFIKTDVEYGVYAFMSRNDSQPIWLWKPLHQDYVESSGEHPKSEYDPYAQSPATYRNWNPGSALYGENVSYDVTPCAWNLKDNETMSFTWPATPQQFELHASPGHVTNLTDKPMTISYAEPMPSDSSSSYLKNGSVVLDTTSRILRYIGPLDFWNWSKTQNAADHQVLHQQWVDINGALLPESTPWVEFGMVAPVELPHIHHFVISGVDDLPVVGQQTNLSITAYDQFDRVFDGTHGANYTGTVHFSSNKSSSVTLPNDYHFVVGDHGVKTFTATFNAAGWFQVNVSDTVATATGNYTDIMAIPTPQVIDHFTISSPAGVLAEKRVDVTVTAWNQYGRVFHEYNGTVSFSTNATGNYTLPSNYTFLMSDRGVHLFQGNITWDEAGIYLLTVVDRDVITANGTITDIVVAGGPSVHFLIYNMLQDDWMPFWVYRWPNYGTDLILSNEKGNNTMIYYWGGDESIWGPYRMNITANNLSNVNIRDPLFMPVMDKNTTFGNSSATVNVYFQYLYWNWWNNTWVPKWQNDSNWDSSQMDKQTRDGWYLGVNYNVTMSREAAQQWLRLPITVPSDQVAAWWATNSSSFKKNWGIWLLDQENNVSDIYNAYEYPGTLSGPYASLTELPNGDVRLDMALIGQGYEIIMDRWLSMSGICPHQPYLENLTMSAHMNNRQTNLTLDTVCQYAMKAQKANKSAGTGSAWTFEALRIDYVASSPNHPHSDYDRYVGLLYESWNAGDVWFGQLGAQDAYETTPGWFNLTKSETLTFQLPKHDVIAYLGTGVRQSSVDNITYGKWNLLTGTNLYGKYPHGDGSVFGNRTDYSDYDSLVRHGSMSLGFYITNLVPGVGAANQPLDLNSMYDPVNKTLTIKGPHNFDNSGRGAGNAMYHGAPWIEFNVTYPGSTAIINSAPGPIVVDHGSAAASEPASVSGNAALMAVISAALASIFVMAVGLRRRFEC